MGVSRFSFALFAEADPEERKRNRPGDDAEHEEVEMRCSQFPVRSIHGEIPRRSDSAPAGQENREPIQVDLEIAEQSLKSFVGGICRGFGRKEVGEFLQVEALDGEERHDGSSKAFSAGFVFDEGEKSVLEKFDRMRGGHRFGRDLCCSDLSYHAGAVPFSL